MTREPTDEQRAVIEQHLSPLIEIRGALDRLIAAFRNDPGNEALPWLMFAVGGSMENHGQALRMVAEEQVYPTVPVDPMNLRERLN